MFDKEKLHRINNHILISQELTPTENHQLWDEMLDKERSLGASLRFQRDLDGRFP